MLTVGALATLILLSCAIGTWVVATSDVSPFMIFPGPSLEITSRTVDEYYVRPYYHAVYYFSGCLTCLLLEDFRKRKIQQGCIGDFLAWNIFAPLSRLTFGVYLIHLPFLQLLLRASRERIHWSTFNIVTLLFGVLIWSFLLAYAAFILCEAPTNALSKLALGALMGTRHEKSGAHRAEPSENAIKPSVNGENKVLSQAKETGTIAFARGFIGASYDLQSVTPNSGC
ncbi:hypothetical protein MTO96_019765 [Rhipicephalus appendiculatus]